MCTSIFYYYLPCIDYPFDRLLLSIITCIVLYERTDIISDLYKSGNHTRSQLQLVQQRWVLTSQQNNKASSTITMRLIVCSISTIKSFQLIEMYISVTSFPQYSYAESCRLAVTRQVLLVVLHTDNNQNGSQSKNCKP